MDTEKLSKALDRTTAPASNVLQIALKKTLYKKSLIDSLYKVVRTNLDTDTHCISFYSIFSRSKTELWINSAP